MYWLTVVSATVLLYIWLSSQLTMYVCHAEIADCRCPFYISSFLSILFMFTFYFSVTVTEWFLMRCCVVKKLLVDSLFSASVKCKVVP